MIVALKSAVGHGFAAGVATGLGLATMAALWTLAALLGLDAAFRVFPWAYGALKLAGAAYLLWIAWATWRDARKAPGEVALPRAAAFRRGLLVNLSNPKSVIFSAAVLVVIFPPDLSVTSKALIALDQFVFEAVAYAILSFFASRRAVARRVLALKPVFDWVTAAIFAAFGLRLLIAR